MRALHNFVLYYSNPICFSAFQKPLFEKNNCLPESSIFWTPAFALLSSAPTSPSLLIWPCSDSLRPPALLHCRLVSTGMPPKSAIDPIFIGRAGVVLQQALARPRRIPPTSLARTRLEASDVSAIDIHSYLSAGELKSSPITTFVSLTVVNHDRIAKICGSTIILRHTFFFGRKERLYYSFKISSCGRHDGRQLHVHRHGPPARSIETGMAIVGKERAVCSSTGKVRPVPQLSVCVCATSPGRSCHFCHFVSCPPLSAYHDVNVIPAASFLMLHCCAIH